jgi:SAM-dependent methyltransferase
VSPKPKKQAAGIVRKPSRGPKRRTGKGPKRPQAPERETRAASNRRPLTHVKGAERHDGDPRRAERLAKAFRVSPADRELPTKGVHGIHPYPARFHPAWARNILAMTPPDAVVLDPFCGSGTVLVESSLSGRRSMGSDVNAVGIRIAKLRTQRRDEDFLEKVVRNAQTVFERSRQRRDTPFGALAVGNKSFAPHVLTQLISLRDTIEHVRDPEVREVLLLCMTPLLGKFGSKPNKRAPEVSRHAVRDHFLKRSEKMVLALADFANDLPDHLPDPDIREADARRLPFEDASADVVITSPPYPGVYHYALEQRLTAKWMAPAGLGKDMLKKAWSQEMGRRGTRPGSWIGAMGPVLRGLVRILRPGGRMFLVIGDGVETDEAAFIDDQLGELLRERSLPLQFVAAVSQERPHWHEDTAHLFAERPRREHLLELERTQ